MYRIRLVSGKEQVYPSIQELTAGVQRGEVTADALIYHQRSDRWLSIESHPHYRMAVEGGTATRTSRLKFTRPSSPASAPRVLPTPAAQKPDQGDLEELNRLLVLLDPLPTPAQRAEPEPAPAPAPPELTLVRPEPVEAPEVSEAPEPLFGTMLRLDDLDLAPAVEADDAEPVDARAPVIAPAAGAMEEPASADLGLPIEIHLDEIPVPADIAPVEVEMAEPEAIEPAMPVVEEAAADEPEPVMVAAPAPGPVVEREVISIAPAHRDEVVPPPATRRLRPMLFVAAAALIAAVIFAFTSGGDDADQGLVTLASATAPSTAATRASVPAPPVDSAQTAPARTTPAPSVGFPVDAPATPATTAGTPRDSIPSVGVLPSAPTIELPSAGTEALSAKTASARVSSGGGAELARGYAASYGILEREFSSQMDRAGLVRLFGQTQLTTNDGLAGARRALDGATSAVRQYHVMEGVIERAYQDSARALERSGESLRDWMTHPTLKESKEAADEGTRLLGQIDAVFALLQAQAGRYQVNGNSVHFDNADAGARYAELQGWITRRLEHWSGQPTSSVPTTVKPILDGIGLTRLPVSR
jgi:hypothetical protein